MASISYSFTLKADDGSVVDEQECLLEVDPAPFWQGGAEVEWDVSAVRLWGAKFNLLESSDPLLKLLAERIRKAALADEDFIDLAYEHCGIAVLSVSTRHGPVGVTYRRAA